MLWPISVAMASTEDGSVRHLWFREKLGYISDKMGARMAQMLLDQPKKESWDLSCLKPEAAVT